jgi:hypothetical protein
MILKAYYFMFYQNTICTVFKARCRLNIPSISFGQEPSSTRA